MPATAASIETHYVNSFKDGLAEAFQKTESILQPYVELTPQNSEEQYYDRVGAADDMIRDTTRYGTNPNQEIAFDRRRSVLEDWEIGKMIEEKDLLRVATDPTNEYSRQIIYSCRRKQDDIILDSVYSSAYTGKKGETEVKWVADGGTSFAGKIKVGALSVGLRDPITAGARYVVEAGNYEGTVVSADFSTSGTVSGLTIPKLMAYKSTLMRQEVLGPQDNINLFIGVEQWEDLLNTPEIKNSDYNVRKALADGNVTTFMGYTFIPYNGLPVDSNGYRRCLALPTTNTKMGSRYGVKLAMALPLKADMWRLPDRKNIPYIYAKMACKGVRMWGEMVGEIRCSE